MEPRRMHHLYHVRPLLIQLNPDHIFITSGAEVGGVLKLLHLSVWLWNLNTHYVGRI